MSDPYKRALYQRNRLIVLESANYKCQWPGCDRPATTCDHIIPLSSGGSNDIANLRASCARCNSRGGMAIVNQRRADRKLGRRSRGW